MEEILDQAFNENKKDETRINRGMALIRLIICLRFSYVVYLTFRPKSNIQIIDNTIFEVISIFLMFVIVYNFRQILSELKQRFIVTFKRVHKLKSHEH